MTDEEMDAFVAQGVDLTVPEGGPVHTTTERELNDAELLQSRPPRQSVPIADTKPLPQLRRLDDTTGWKEIKIEPDWNWRDGILGSFFEYAGGHPLSMVVNFKLPLAIGGKGNGWLPVKGTTAGIQMASDPVGMLEEALLPSLGQRNIDDAWGNTIWNKKMHDMIANPEDYAE